MNWPKRPIQSWPARAVGTFRPYLGGYSASPNLLGTNVTRFTTLPARAREERGAILILTALVMIILLLIAALATDLGAWYRQGQEQQRAADVASLNGVQAHDASLKAYYDANGVTGYSSLTDPQKADAEDQAFQDAVNSVLGALAAGGMNITDVPVITTAIPPAESTATVTAVDGTSIVITRTATNAITVNVGRQGDQYFSNFVRDAPEITREGSAVISNCNADCSRDIEIEPPFPGFEASGKGDGFGPLLRGDTQIWAVNHHIRGSGQGNIVCMDRNTEDFCAGVGNDGTGLFSTDRFDTHNRPIPEYIDNDRDRIYFAGRDRSTGMAGLACFDMAAGGFCSPNDFVGFWAQPVVNWSAIVSVVGPWEWNGNLYILAQDGQLGCVNPDTMTACGTWNTDAVGSGVADLSGRPRVSWGQVHNNRLYMINTSDAGSIFHCWDLASQSGCWGGVQTYNSGMSWYSDDDYLNTLSYTTSGDVNGFCRVDPIGNWGRCVNLSGTSMWEPTNLYNYVTPHAVSWVGGAFTFDTAYGPRTYMTLGNANKSVCFDWLTNSGCGVADHWTLAPDGWTRPYGLALITDDCIVGLGHDSRYFTLGVDTMETCTSSTVSTDVYPCECGDGTFRYGVLELPAELLAVLNSADATVTGGGTTITGNLMDGPFDLSPFNGVAAPLELTILVDSKLNSDGSLAWREPYSAQLALTVQPTLTGN